jgi:hypothetical protein
MTKITRRKFLGLGALALPAALGADARFIEPTSLRVTKFNLGGGATADSSTSPTSITRAMSVTRPKWCAR